MPFESDAIDMRKFFRWLVFIVAGFLALLLVAGLLLSVLDVTINLDHLRGGVETSAEAALGRDVSIKGPVRLELSGWPSIEVQDVEIANVPGASAAVFFKAGLARLQIGVMPLLRGELQIGEVTAEKVTLNLENDAGGRANWVFGEDAGKEADAAPKEQLLSFGGLHELSLQQVALTYHDAALGKTLNLSIDSLHGEASPGQPMRMQLDGMLQKQSYHLQLSGGPVGDLLKWSQRWPFTLTGEAFGRKIDASGSVVVKDGEPELGLKLAVRDADIGAILDYFGLVEGMQMTTGVAAIDVLLRGSTLNELVLQSKMVFAVRKGVWLITLPNTQVPLQVQKLRGDITVRQGSKITMDLQGEIRQTPVRFLITGAPLLDYIQAPEELPLKIETEMLDPRLSFDSRMAIPITNRAVAMRLDIEGKRLDNFNELFRLDLPPLGPVSLTARLNVSKAGYEFSKLEVTVGESDLAGSANIDMTRDKPRVNIELVSNRFRIEDFDDKQPDAGDADQADDATVTPVDETAGEKEDSIPADGAQQRRLLSGEILNKYDASLSLAVKQVTSGNDQLGSGSLQLSLQDGRLALEPLQIEAPGGGVVVNLSLLHRGGNIDFAVTANVDHFDYGVLARRVDPETDMGGIVSLDVVLESTAPEIKAIMAQANGHFDFALLPENISAQVFDMWAVNLITAIATKVDQDDASKVNCVVVRLGLVDGLLTEKAVFMDTTQMSVAGKISIDFKAQEIDILMAPKAKRPEFFSLATPVKVRGSFDDFGLGISKIRATRSVISFVTSPIHVPIRRVFKKAAPADGREACELAWEKTVINGVK